MGLKKKRNYTSGLDNDFELGPSEEMNTNNNINQISEDSPFRTSAKLQRSPPRSSILQTFAAIKAIDEDRHLTRLKTEEESAFVELGNKLSTMNSIVSDARNIHKTVRDNLLQAVALYQQLREYREAIALNNVLDAPKSKPDVVKINKETQTVKDSSKDGSKRAASFTPEKNKSTKKVKISQPEEKIKNVNSQNESTWSVVEKKKKNRIISNVNKNTIRDKGETITIKASGLSYAAILKEMKNAIKPDAIGIGIKKIRKTVDGNVLIQMTKGEGQAKKLESAIKGSLGNNIQVHTIAEKFLLDIRDMEETTDEAEIKNAILQASSDAEGEQIKVCNIRDYYGGTKQALVEVSRKVAVTILKGNKIKVGLIFCRVRRKTIVKRCFRCLEQGHLARTCRGKDRSQTCRRCGIDGHKSNTCKNEPRCIICLEAGRKDINHYIGSSSSCGYKT